jgi:hypothetical protein
MNGPVAMDPREVKARRAREQNARLRAQVIAGYGGACACCGERTPEFLALDHIDGNGHSYLPSGRRRTGVKLYPQVIAEGFPTSYRLLCHNCNLSLGYWGYCPHAGVEPSRGGRSGHAGAGSSRSAGVDRRKRNGSTRGGS